MFNSKQVFKLLIAGLAVVGVTMLNPQSASAQRMLRSNSVHGVGADIFKYPLGTRINPNGAIHTPNGRVFYPATKVTRGQSITYHYTNGTRITIRKYATDPQVTFPTPKPTNLHPRMLTPGSARQ